MSIQENLAKINQQIINACTKSNRAPSEVTLLPVSKTKPLEDIYKLYSLGHKRFGENKVQEALEKSTLSTKDDIDWCIIGHLQTNKAKFVAQFAQEVHSLDRLKLAVELDKSLQKVGRSLDVLIQVNTSNEPQKYGISPENLLSFTKELSAFKSLRIKGLMTLALFSADQEKVRPCFARLKHLQEKLRQDSPLDSSWDTLSMGMSGDFELAIEEGSTEVRIGQAIFGTRDTPNSFYWPE
jgi:hypothetical protein